MPFITLEQQTIPYQMRRSERAKRLRIELADNRIEMIVPVNLSNQEALNFVFSKKKWIVKNWAKRHNSMACQRIWPNRWENGAELFVLGRLVKLAVEKQLISKRKVVHHEDTLKLIIPMGQGLSEAEVRAMILYYLQKKAQIYLTEAINQYCPILGRWPNGYKLKQTKRRWGSCGINNRIHINWLLIMAPEGVLEYVVVHELCHLFHRNHSARFWQLVGKLMPEYQTHERWLTKHGHTILPP